MQIRRSRHEMIHHVGGIDAYLKTLLIADPESLAHVRIEAPRADAADFILSHIPKVPGIGFSSKMILLGFDLYANAISVQLAPLVPSRLKPFASVGFAS